MKSSDFNFGYTRREAFRLGMSSLAAVWFGRPLVSALAQTTIAPPPTGRYTLPPLPYPYEALEPQIDTITMQLHHDKHHKAYVDWRSVGCTRTRGVVRIGLNLFERGRRSLMVS